MTKKTKKNAKACIPQPFVRQSLEQRRSVVHDVEELMQIKPLTHAKRACNDRKQFLDQLPSLIKKRQTEQMQYLRALEESTPADSSLKMLFQQFLDYEHRHEDSEQTRGLASGGEAHPSISKYQRKRRVNTSMQASADGPLHESFQRQHAADQAITVYTTARGDDGETRYIEQAGEGPSRSSYARDQLAGSLVKERMKE